jgi:hypothetical protein
MLRLIVKMAQERSRSRMGEVASRVREAASPGTVQQRQDLLNAGIDDQPRLKVI